MCVHSRLHTFQFLGVSVAPTLCLRADTPFRFQPRLRLLKRVLVASKQ
jgi:hypothetical protein